VINKTNKNPKAKAPISAIFIGEVGSIVAKGVYEIVIIPQICGIIADENIFECILCII
jgi:hypothetical protein